MQSKWRLSHARGYIGLGLLKEAALELARIPVRDREEVEVLVLNVAVHQELQRWRPLRRYAAALVRRQPEEYSWWITWAYATRRAVSLAAAEEILLEAERLHEQQAIIHFNLACYACQRGDLAQARQRLTRAIALDAGFRELAKTDTDLIPLHQAARAAGESSVG